MDIAVSGSAGPADHLRGSTGERVVIKGSEIIKGDWQQVSREPSQPEPYPNAYTRIWRIKLADKYFYDPARPDYMKDPANRDVTEIVANDYLPWTKTGLSPGQDEGVLAALGRSVADLANQRDGAFFYDRPSGYLYVRCGDPREAMLELGVRGDTLLIKKQHDLVIRGLEMRQSRGNMAAAQGSQRLLFENCKFMLSDFCDLALYMCDNCTVRHCDMSWAANTGFHLQVTKDCTVEDCTLTFNNFRQYAGGWHDGGMKNIPRNVRTTVRRCELAYNFSTAIWFDTANVDIRLVDNVIHHNRSCGIYHESEFWRRDVRGEPHLRKRQRGDRHRHALSAVHGQAPLGGRGQGRLRRRRQDMVAERFRGCGAIGGRGKYPRQHALDRPQHARRQRHRHPA